jgi:hypothetical protein
VIYRGLWDLGLIRLLHKAERDGVECEGYVVRVDDGFAYGQFRTHVAKYVRASHVTTHGHWMRDAVTPNTLKDELKR